LQLSVDREILRLPGSPLSDTGEHSLTVDQEAEYEFLLWLRNTVKEMRPEIAVETMLKAWRVYLDILKGSIVQGIVEIGNVRNRRLKSYWADLFSDLDEERIRVFCVLDVRGMQEEFESFLYISEGEVLIPQKVVDRLMIAPSDDVNLYYRRIP
jgi:hypothetical protein